MRYLNSLKRWFGNRFIRNKIIIIYLPLIIVPLFVFAYISTMISTNEFVDKTKENVAENMGLIITRIEGILDNSQNCANILVININRVFDQKNYIEKNRINELKLKSLINNELTFALLVFPEVQSATFIHHDGRIYSTLYNADLERDRDILYDSGLIKAVENSESKDNWFPMQRREFLVEDKHKAVLTLVKKVNNIESGERLGYIVINISEETIASIYRDIGLKNNGTYLITDKDGIIISARSKADMFNPIGNTKMIHWIKRGGSISEISQVNGEKMLAIVNPFPQMNWRLVSIIPLDELTAENSKLVVLTFLIAALCLVFAIFGAILLSKLIANPIVKLTGHMLKKDGSTDLYPEPGYKDEIGLLASGFNTMISRNKELLARINDEQKKKREYELSLMQLQMKPHFLYNTLDVICRLADMDRNREVRKATKALADFYRVALSKGKEIITVREEISNVENYLSIQKIRYSHVFDYEVCINEDILGCKIPKLTIQPLVENSIYHGLKMAGKKGKIVIEGCKVDNTALIKVMDDGTGISDERLKQIFNSSDLDTSSISFGLKNLDERVKIFYGEEYGISIRSQKGAGTEVSVTIPLQVQRVE